MVNSIFLFLMVFCINIYTAEQALSEALEYLCQAGKPRTPTSDEFLQVLNAVNEKTTALLDQDKIEEGIYVQKIFVPSGSKVCFMGDIHGSPSLFRNFDYIRNRNLLDKIDYWVFLGDYADGGNFGIEAYFGLLKLKLERWDNVFMLKGNHETFGIAYMYGLFGYESGKPSEIELKFGKNQRGVRKPLELLFSILPMALYIGSGNPSAPDWIQSCHGGIEPTFNPNEFLQEARIDYFNIQDKIESNQECLDGFNFKRAIDLFYRGSFSEVDDCGFNWCDFCDDADGLGFDRSRGYICNPTQVKRIYLDPCNIRAIIRGHQDREFGLKIGGQRHWKNLFPESEHAAPGEFSFKLTQIADHPVLTLSTAAGVKEPYDCFCILQTADLYDNWTVTPYERLIPVN